MAKGLEGKVWTPDSAIWTHENINTKWTPENGLWTPQNPATIWTQGNKRICPERVGKTDVFPKLIYIPKLTEDQEFFWAAYLKDIWSQLTERIKLRFDMDGLIGLGKSTIPTIMRFYMDAKMISEDRESLNLKLLYGDFNKNAFPFNLYLITTERPSLIRGGMKEKPTAIFDRAPRGEGRFIRTLYELGSISEAEYRILNERLEKQEERNGYPEALILLEGRPQTGFNRATKRGSIQEVGKKDTRVTPKIAREIRKIYNQYLELISTYAPSQLAKYQKLFSEPLPKVLKAGGLTLPYQKKLNESYKDYIEMYNGPTSLQEINVDKLKRGNTTHQVTVMNALKYNTFFSLERQGYRVEEDFAARKVHVYDSKGNKIT